MPKPKPPSHTHPICLVFGQAAAEPLGISGAGGFALPRFPMVCIENAKKNRGQNEH